MGNKSSSHVPPPYPRDIPPYYLNPPPPPGHPLCPGPPLGHPFAPPPFHHSMISLHHPNGTDSGYMTSPADTERWKAHNWKNGQSRLSLNEAFIYETAPPPFMPLPPPNPKQLKKWQKKHKKLLKKMASMPPPILPPQQPIAPLYTRAYSVDNLNSHTLDGYAELPVVSKKNWKNRKEQRKSHHFGESLPEVPAGPPRSTVSRSVTAPIQNLVAACETWRVDESNSCSNGFMASDLRAHTSVPSTNLSEHSRMPSTNTDHSSSVIRSPSSVNSKGSPIGISKDALGQRVSLARCRPESVADRTLVETATVCQPHRSIATNTINGAEFNGQTDSSQCNSSLLVTGVSCGSCAAAAVIAHENEIHHSNAQFSASQVSNASAWKPERFQSERYGEAESFENDAHTPYGGNKNDHCDTTSTDDAFDSVLTERTIPIKITPEAKKILERNAQMFPRNETSENERNSELSRSERNETASGNAITLQSNMANRYYSPQPSTPLTHQSLKRDADYGSTVSSLTQSSNMKTEVSDIDFSWVNDVENRLEKEIAFVKEDYPRHQMPVRYFGMDEDERQMSGSLQRTPSERGPTMQPSEAFAESEPRRELNEIRSDVRSKAAMFDGVAMRNTQANAECQTQMGSRYRSRSTPRSDQNMYIPQPDYNNFEPISVDTSQSDSQRYFGFRVTNDVIGTTMSPSERRIRKFELNPSFHSYGKNVVIFEHTNGNVNASTTVSAHELHNARYGRNVVPQRNPNNYRNEILQRNRTYDATEYYRQNAARRQADKPWRASVAY
ncbi:unnamed protein product [Toxocara canis]|uniref:JmjC domain-containing protein n=1 Tax=Toxocara canis TaxID=6265 RepID=A0A183TV11_TOXCA|nr:unnamed protein product [Toxocara canis]